MEESILDEGLANEDIKKNVEYAGFWIRVGAGLLDGLILLPITGLSFYNMLSMKSLPLMIVLTLIAFLYKPLLEWKRGATLGKQAVGIKVVDEDLEPIDAGQAFQRYFPWIITYILSIMTNFYIFNSSGFEDLEGFMEMSMALSETPYAMFSNIYNVIFFIIIIYLVFDKKKQGLHDKFARTYNIRVRK